MQPVSAFASADERVRRFETWSACSDGYDAKRSAAPAETSGAEKDVPSPRRNSIGPQSEYP